MRIIACVSLMGVLLSACGANTILVRSDSEQQANPEIENLKKQVLALSGTVDMINNFVATDFAACGGTELSSLEKKICKIAQSANAEQMLKYTGQLASWNAVLTEALYGEDCFEVTGGGCPASTSILGRTAKLETDLATANGNITTLTGDIATLTGNVATLQGEVTALGNRLNLVETSVAAINTTISGIQTNITSLQNRTSALEALVADGLNPAKFLNTYEICKGVPGVSRPESVLIAGDWSKMISYVKVTTTQEGLATISATDASWFTTTNLSPNKCNFKVYTFGADSGLNICWNNTNRSATEANINSICNNGRQPYGTPTQCKCLRDF